MAYGTKDYAGLKTFRDNEHKALRLHAINRFGARGRKREVQTGSKDLFAEHEARRQEAGVGDDVKRDMDRATPLVIEMVRRAHSLKFEQIASRLMEDFMLRETNVKDLLLKLASDGKIEKSWGHRGHKPREGDTIRLKP